MLTLASAREHYAHSALIARRATTEARKVRGNSLAVARVVAAHQITQAQRSEAAVAAMLAEQGLREAPPAALNLLAFTTSATALDGMLGSAGPQGFDRLVASLVQSSGRAAESVSAAVRNVGHVRQLSPPSCSRCAVLAGRVYRYSEGFKRHPGCDCTMIPVLVANPSYAADPVALAERGLVTGLSKADMRALRDGADVGQVVNVRRKAAGLQESGAVLTRAGRPTPEGIYRRARSHDEAVSLLAQAGYIR